MDFTLFLNMLAHFDQHLGSMIAQYHVAVYAMLFVVVFCEIGVLPLFFLPGDPLLFICGAFCATGALNIWVLMPLLIAAAVLGSTLNYGTGRVVGQKAYERNHPWLNREALARSHAFYERYGHVTFLFSPFVAVVRTFAPFVGGVAGMTFTKFLFWVFAGALAWVLILVPSGYFFGNIPWIRDHMGAIVLLGLGLGLGSLAVSGLLQARERRL
jgi:membrane-associated protein